MRKSPFDEKSSPALTPEPLNSPFGRSASSQAPVSVPVDPVVPSAFARQPRQDAMPMIPYTTDDIDRIGKDSEARLSQLSERVTKKMTLNRMGEIGDLLLNVQQEVNNLDPSNLVKTDGIFGRLRQRFTDLKGELTKRFQTADGAFSKLRDGMNVHIARLSEWERDDQDMYAQNYERFKDILASLAQIDGIIAQLQTVEAAWPTVDPSDPEAMMKAQQRFVLQDLITRAKVRRESILRAKIKCELNAPEILAMKSASGKLIAKLAANANDIIPEIMREIAKQIQRLNQQDAINGLRSFREFANVVLTRGAQSTKETVLQANQAFNEATITVETITSMQNSVRDMVQGIQSISIEAEKRRISEEKTIQQNQEQLLRDLQSKGAI
jgi:uncharacterized protein YaaN involved in tellurite resistance